MTKRSHADDMHTAAKYATAATILNADSVYFTRRSAITEASQDAYRRIFNEHRAMLGVARARIKARDEAWQIERRMVDALHAEYGHTCI